MRITARLEPDYRTRREGRRVQRILDQVTRPSRLVWRTVGDAVRDGFLANFREERSRRGRWAPLAPATVRERLRLGYGGRHPILRRTGQLRRSYVDRNFWANYEARFRWARGWEGRFGSDLHYARYHESGVMGRLPARPVTPLTTGSVRRMVQRIDGVLEFLNG